jgi:hypothetical protein
MARRYIASFGRFNRLAQSRGKSDGWLVGTAVSPLLLDRLFEPLRMLNQGIELHVKASLCV